MVPALLVGLVKNIVLRGDVMKFVCFNTKLNLIEGYKNIGDSTGDIFVKSGLIYNEYISGGTFFKIP